MTEDTVVQLRQPGSFEADPLTEVLTCRNPWRKATACQARMGPRMGENVAAVMLIHGLVPFRTSAVSGTPRAPYCMIGNCFDCLVEIDGQPNRQACLEPVREGMRIRRQMGAPSVTP